MATQEQYPTDSDGTTQEKTQHSGDLGLEYPVDELATSLDEDHRMGLLATPNSPAPLLPPQELPTEPEKKKTRNHRRTAMITLGTIAGTAVLGVGGAYVALRGADTNTEPQDNPSVSGPATAGGETVPTTAPEQEATPDGNITMENLSSYKIEYDASPEEVGGSYADILANIVTTRFQNKEFGMKTDDLVYLVDPSNAELTHSYAQYVDNLVQHLVEKEQQAQEQNLATDGVVAGVSVEVSSGEMTPSGAIVELKHNYGVYTGMGEYLGSLLGNDDPTRLTLERQEVTLPNGESDTTLRIVDRFDTVNNQPA